MKTTKKIFLYGLFVFAYAVMAAFVVLIFQLAGCRSDSVLMRVLWFVAGYLFGGYLNRFVFPFLERKYP